MRFNICRVKTNEFFRVYDDLVRALAASLADIGHSCTETLNDLALDAVNILVGSTIFASRHLSLATLLKGKPYIVYQLESLDDRHGLLPQWPEYWELLQNAGAIWDYSPPGIAYLNRENLGEVHYVPPGFHRSIDVLRPRQNPDIDVLFVGSPHERRHRVIEALRARGLCVVNLDAAFGARRNRYIARAKIVLNIHAWDELDGLETVRLSFLLANRVFVVSEQSDHDPYDGGVIYAPYERLVDACLDYLRKPAQTRREIAEHGYDAIRLLDFPTVLRATLAQMGGSTLQRLVLSDRSLTRNEPVEQCYDGPGTASAAALKQQDHDLMSVHVINLDRSPDRLLSFNQRNRHVLPVERFAGIEGRTVDRSSLIERGLLSPEVRYTDGAIGVALSHLTLWDIAIPTNRPITIVEDDAVFHREYRSQAERILAEMLPDWHILFWGYNCDAPVVLEWIAPWPSSCMISFRQNEIKSSLDAYQAAKLDPGVFKLAEACGLVCYSISPAGARILKQFCLPIREMPIRFEGLNRIVPNYAIDVMMNGMYRRMNAFACFPPLVVTPNDKSVSQTVELPRRWRR